MAEKRKLVRKEEKTNFFGAAATNPASSSDEPKPMSVDEMTTKNDDPNLEGPGEVSDCTRQDQTEDVLMTPTEDMRDEGEGTGSSGAVPIVEEKDEKRSTNGSG